MRFNKDYIKERCTSRKLHTYLDGIGPFKYRDYGPWKLSIARRPCPQRVAAACVGLGPCTVSIFSCPALATLAGQASFFCLSHLLTLTLYLYLYITDLGPTRELFSFDHDLNTQRKAFSSRITVDTKLFHRNLMTLCIKYHCSTFFPRG